ncbi:hypothetical protein IMCC3317_31620 [Kordia antarctica]|uniref:Uncharacterized protein n=1 Tax=Kordia antarctica TaxID=1218801 RepID=A0A7L4ZMR3_9FLAO|nr:hypothetical protein [Kordia antarctica]QHI37780.1 hypothetical protein IMCC3317_31620 [Kordia antarctica]
MTPEYRIEAEKLIKEYLGSYDDIKEIVNIKCEETFTDLDVVINVWNVKTENEAYWLVEGGSTPMNMYTQGANYLSADEAYSFHMGLTQRLAKRYQNEFKHIIDEIPLNIEHLKSINRKLKMASEKLDIHLEPEEFQSIGLLCRESLIDLSKELCERNPQLVKEKGLKKADFKGVSNAFIDYYIPGNQNSDLRNYSRKMVDSAWSYNSMIVHSQNKKYPDAKIALLFTSATVSLIENLFYKHLGFDQELACSECGSLQIEFLEYEKDKIKQICKKCEHEEKIIFAE